MKQLSAFGRRQGLHCIENFLNGRHFSSLPTVWSNRKPKKSLRATAIVHLLPDIFLRKPEFLFATVEVGETGLDQFAMPLLNGHFAARFADAVPEVLHENQTLRRRKLRELIHCWVHLMLLLRMSISHRRQCRNYFTISKYNIASTPTEIGPSFRWASEPPNFIVRQNVSDKRLAYPSTTG